MQLSSDDLRNSLNATIHGYWTASGISIDSRTIEKGDLFVALKGENFDGHDYISTAIEMGAVAVVSDRTLEIPNYIHAQDTLIALQEIGKLYRASLSCPVIGITGSAGKTSTKEGLQQILNLYGTAYASEKNLNNHIGVPLNLSRIPEKTDYAVIEMGMSNAGELSQLTQLANPNISVITNIYPMHIENFDDLSGIAAAKAEIFNSNQNDQIAIINSDASHYDLLLAKAKEAKIRRIITFGKTGDIQLKSQTNKPTGTEVYASIGSKDLRYQLTQSGEGFVYNSLCILAVIHALDLDPNTAIQNMHLLSPLEGRGKQHIAPLSNGGHFTLIDHSYSGQPESMRHAIQELGDIPIKGAGRKIFIMGQMAELGEHNEQEHISLGQTVAKTNIDIVIGVGQHTQLAFPHLSASQNTQYFESADLLNEEVLNELIKEDDVVLIKGSRYSSQVYQIVERLIQPTASAKTANQP